VLIAHATKFNAILILITLTLLPEKSEKLKVFGGKGS
jgi:hypothetical protein